MGEISGRRGSVEERAFKSRGGFGFRVRQARARPSNTAIWDLLMDGRHTEAVLAWAREVEEGAICR